MVWTLYSIDGVLFPLSVTDLASAWTLYCPASGHCFICLHIDRDGLLRRISSEQYIDISTYGVAVSEWSFE